MKLIFIILCLCSFAACSKSPEPGTYRFYQVKDGETTVLFVLNSATGELWSYDELISITDYGSIKQWEKEPYKNEVSPERRKKSIEEFEKRAAEYFRRKESWKYPPVPAPSVE